MSDPKTETPPVVPPNVERLVRFKFWANGSACGLKVKATGEVAAKNEHDAFEAALKLMEARFAGYVEKASPGVVAYPSIRRIKSNTAVTCAPLAARKVDELVGPKGEAE